MKKNAKGDDLIADRIEFEFVATGSYWHHQKGKTEDRSDKKKFPKYTCIF